MSNPSSIKPALRKDVDGTLAFEVPDGTPGAAGTFAVYDENGDATAVTAGVPTLSGSTLTAAIAAAVLDALGENYRVRFSFSIGSTPYVRDVWFDVVTAPIYQTLTVARFNAEFFPVLTEQVFPSGSGATAAVCLAAGWRDTLNAIADRGRNPNRLKSAARLEPAHAAFAAAHAAKNYGAAGDWQTWGEKRLQEANDAIDRLIANAAYDFDDDNKLGAGEAHANVRRFRMEM